MFNKNYRPLVQVVNYENCDYEHLRYQFRQKIRAIQSLLISIRNMSNNDYRLVLFDDGCMMVDFIRNKVLWTFDYYSAISILIGRLEELYRFYNYEKNQNFNTSRITRNDYYMLKKKYYGN